VRSFQPAEREVTKPSKVMAFLANYRLQIFWLSLYYWTLAAVFSERFYSYAWEREHRGLRRIAGWGIATTRGAASSMMYIYALLLLSMCKNLMTLLRETPAKHLIPFDNAFDFHIISAFTGFLFSSVHILGHFVNFFSIATEPSGSLACLFTEVNWVTDYLPSFYWWLFHTPTGISGYVATLVLLALGIFSFSYFRRNFFTPFIISHQVFAFMFYCLMLMHGWAQLVQVPIFHTYLIGPLFLYVVDKLISVARLGNTLKVLKVEWLPSDVLHLRFARPPNFNYKAGQYLQLASHGISASLFHPFTITSAPHEPWLSLHIRAVGPWTRKLRQIYNPNATKYPDVLVTGPYGSEADTWSTCSHVIMVGAGIGVTPFASILKDFVFRSKNDKTFKTKKLFFFWVCKTQKHFEWLVDIIREAELEDVKGRLEVHIFVTELQQKFDLRTVMLYICEKQFYKVHNTSLFTGLQAATHFGRPNFVDLFTQIQSGTPKADKMVVFSCVPANMLKNVEKACDAVNSHSGPKFFHSADGFF
jgi:dual oxidase